MLLNNHKSTFICFLIFVCIGKIFNQIFYTECESINYTRKKYEFIKKWSVVSKEEFTIHFPINFIIGCIVLKEKIKSYMVSTLEHWDIESKEGLCEYIICTYNINILTA